MTTDPAPDGEESLDALDARGVLDAAERVVRRRRLVEVEDLLVLAQWAVLHASDPADDPDTDVGRAARRWDRLVQLGGEGTPGVRDSCLGEIAIARGTGTTATVNAMADVLDLQHRLPRVWARCAAGEAEIWLARRVAKTSRHLSLEAVAHVDRQVAAVIGREGGARVLDVAAGAVVAADPWLAESRAQAERRRRYVGFGRVDEHGLRTIIARVTAGDALWIKATVEQVADILTPAHPHASRDEVRAVAFGYLARPAELLALLLAHQQRTTDQSDADEPEPQPEPQLQPQPQPEADPAPQSRATAFPADLLAALRAADLSALAPRATLYVHLHEAAVRTGAGVARAEGGLGPVTLAGLRELLCRTRLTIRPVLDLSDRVRTTAYEHPDSVKERAHLVTGGDYWPYADSRSRDVDHDHVTPYDASPCATGPPGQTGTHNCGPLTRRHHRWKTHGGHRARQCGDGRYVWLTRHGLGRLVDHRGTRTISAEDAAMILDAPPGVDLYPGGPVLEWG